MWPARKGVPLLLAVVLLTAAGPARAALPSWLPRYDLEITLDLANHLVHTRQQITWTNCKKRSAADLVFNAHSHFAVPAGKIGYYAKTLETLRMTPGEALDTGPSPLRVERVTLGPGDLPGVPQVTLPFRFDGETGTDLVVELPKPVGPGESVTVVVWSTLRLPQKMGRWGQWDGVTFLSNWLPVVAVYDEEGWHPTPFIPWHQPFFNESGIYHALVTLPCGQKVACTGSITATRELPGGLQELSIAALGVRDFALLCSGRYEEFCDVAAGCGPGGAPVRVHVLAFPEHAYYAREMVRICCEVIPLFSRWFGCYPYADFTIAESFFGWNGNECSTLVMIDERIFAMPHLAGSYIDYLVAHETCHQWWYNLVGTNGYCETWMDEALAVHFSHRWMTEKCGQRNNDLLRFPKGLEWLPNIKRHDYRSYSLLGTIGRGENGPVVQPISSFAHVVNLFSMCYDKGSRIVGMIEERLGPVAFLDFIRRVQCRYRYRILRVADFQRELEEYTGNSWEKFFRDWLYGPGLCDWCVEQVSVVRRPSSVAKPNRQRPTDDGQRTTDHGPYKVTVLLHQKGKVTEQTVLGISMSKEDSYELRIPIMPDVCRLELDEVGAVVEALPDQRVRVEVTLPRKPKQITVDPDQILVDGNPANNFWKAPIRYRITPLYTFLEETDITNAHDRLNVLFGPWIYRPGYFDPWYTRGTLVGLRAGLYRTQHFSGGIYTAYRTDYRDIVAGADGIIDHWPFPKTQVGFNLEQRLYTFQSGNNSAFRGSLFGRYVKSYSSSLYLAPMEYYESFAFYQDNFLPFNRHPVAGALRYDNTEAAGVHYHLNYLTPYWDPAGGFQVDLSYASGAVEVANTPYQAHTGSDHKASQQLVGQLSYVRGLPDLTGLVADRPGLATWGGPLLCWLADTRLAIHLYGAGALPSNVDFYPLGGSNLFRGFSQAERQGSLVWVTSTELRVPVARELHWDVLDHSIAGRNLYVALFHDMGNAYTNGHAAGPVAQALGAGLRLDVALFGFVERSVLRFDVAKAINANAPLQFWFGVQHPF